MVQLYTGSVDRYLAGVIRHDLPRVVHDRKKFQAFKKFGQFDDQQARDALQPGKGPELRVSRLPAGTYGQYLAGDEIHINETIVRQHANIIDSWSAASAFRTGEYHQWQALVRKATLIVESIILHELVHWGDLKDGADQDPHAKRRGWKDIGHEFVHEAYGSAFAIEIERIRRRRYKSPKMDIEGWMGWGTFKEDGETYVFSYDPWRGRGPGSGPPRPRGY